MAEKFLIEQLQSWKIILASGSPRRQQLLKELGLKFAVITKEISEDFPSHLKKKDAALFLAKKKSDAFSDEITENTIVITADTIVCIGDEILNKPENYEEAVKMLTTLSGKKHEVVTAVCLKTSSRSILFHATTDVYFKELTLTEINYYLKLYQPYDKAGAYGVQEWIGLIGLERIDGSYHNVMGLPVQDLYKKLAEILNG
jgi:septum formation protein